MRRRPTARVLVLDPAGRVLLFRFEFRHGPLDGLVFWATPGGALEPGESFEEGARRELAEETGLIVADLGPEIGRKDYVMRIPDGEVMEVEERYFLLQVEALEVADAGWTELERQVMTEHRWWTPEEIRAAAEKVYPEDLVEMLAAVAAPAACRGV
jgi:8-oxo-dGTP pyrophosphatase MutT (NUDIX family)